MKVNKIFGSKCVDKVKALCEIFGSKCVDKALSTHLLPKIFISSCKLILDNVM